MLAMSISLVRGARRLGSSLGFMLVVLGCAAVYPELATPIREAPPQKVLDPPPPDELLYLHVRSAEIPRRTRDGREWDELGGKAADPLAIVFLDGVEIFRTDVAQNTLRPEWRAPKVNYRIPSRSVVKIELWDRNSVKDRPICVASLADVQDDVAEGGRNITCESGARIELIVKPARARLGVGLYYELRREQVYVTRVLAESPAERAGITGGERILRVQGKDVATMSEGEVQSLINANTRTGVTLTLLDGTETRTVELMEGPIYPVDGGPIVLKQ